MRSKLDYPRSAQKLQLLLFRKNKEKAWVKKKTPFRNFCDKGEFSTSIYEKSVSRMWSQSSNDKYSYESFLREITKISQ